jgi:hypothetical protein
MATHIQTVADGDDARRRLQRLEDLAEIRLLIAQYAWHAARAEAGEMAALFTNEGTMEASGTVLCGRREIEAHFRKLRPGAQVPLVHNVLIELHGDTASSTCTTLTPWIDDGLGACGWYQDAYRRDDGRWRFTQRHWTRHGSR